MLLKCRRLFVITLTELRISVPCSEPDFAQPQLGSVIQNSQTEREVLLATVFSVRATLLWFFLLQVWMLPEIVFDQVLEPIVQHKVISLHQHVTSEYDHQVADPNDF